MFSIVPHKESGNQCTSTYLWIYCLIFALLRNELRLHAVGVSIFHRCVSTCCVSILLDRASGDIDKRRYAAAGLFFDSLNLAPLNRAKLYGRPLLCGCTISHSSWRAHQGQPTPQSSTFAYSAAAVLQPVPATKRQATLVAKPITTEVTTYTISR